MSRCLHRVAMPAEGWWVQIDHKATLNRLGLDLAEPLRQAGVPLLTLSGTTGENRAVTTLLAQHVRGQSLFDGSLPLGIQFTSKTGYGTCWAWWDRRADDVLTPGENDPKTLEDLNVDGDAFRAVTTDWQLEVLPGKPHYLRAEPRANCVRRLRASTGSPHAKTLERRYPNFRRRA
ncbi:hypothetical protein SAMN05216184_11534 [Georgenia satyanarayanai]|uniref:RES domain-containing protein n=1 Tax=Georgenia satyanarayanai TaxID=860221 RepID=A0A2Y9APW7_9MICO|nr:hypothetical protein [Georgenia satyanarayanai]PYF97325.1 hypothetical protein A8987_11534 [Georgenia satyanarayanai]SSA46106.1 hypothetical protein SAMN05216184_11534 [Georgenia satyanarayanai]